jgi:dTDP-4-amino-4,6-dideoxygalactose transaminase
LPIPLVRPAIPPPEEWLPFYEDSRRSGQFSNFGPCEQRATFTLSEITQKTAVLVSSGTAAVQALVVACTPELARVAVPDFTFTATRNAVEMARRKVVIAPCDRHGLPRGDWLTAKAADFESLIVTAPFGCHPNFAYYDELGKKLGKGVIYDCAGGWGLDFSATHNPVAISFHATKNLPIGEGGAALFDRDEGVRPTKAKNAINFMGGYGFNGKMSEVHAAILCAQLTPKNLLAAEQRALHRKTLLSVYEFHCDRLDSGIFNTGAPSLCAFVDKKMQAEEVVRAANASSVAAKRGYWPLVGGHPETHFDLSQVVVLPAAVTVKEAEHIATWINAKG